MRAHPAIVVVLLAALVLGACTRDEGPVVETATVRAGEVVQVVAAPAQLDASARASVNAPLGGEVEELLVTDGDIVAAGEPLVRLASDSLENQVEQAEAAMASAEQLGAVAEGAGLDVSPVLSAFRGQLDTLFPSLLEALGSQLDTTEAALDAALAGVDESTRVADELSRGVRDAFADAQQVVDAAADLEALEELEVPDGSKVHEGAELPELPAPELDPETLPSLPDGEAVTASLREARRAASESRRQLAATERAFQDASQQLLAAEQELGSQAAATSAAQAAAVDAQVAQADLALEAARARIDDLLVTAPIGGVVELARDGAGGGAPSLEGLPGGVDELTGELGGDAGLEDLLGGVGGSGGAGGARSGPITDGAAVGAGQELMTVFDLSGFTARAEVDEIDVVHVREDQPVVVRVDAFPGVELEGTVDHVALAPSRDVTGGALYPVTVTLTQVPDDVQLRVGLTASAEIEVRRIEGDRVVPTSALLRRGDREVVHVVRDGVAVEVPVEVVALGEEDAAVEGELSSGEQVVTIGVELIEDGDEVPT